MPESQTDRTPASALNWLLRLSSLVMIVVLIGYLLLPEVGARHFPDLERCASNLRVLALAMLNYHEKNGCFPPAFVADKSGRPMHSWRVLLLPYLERNDLYEQYNFNEPWDSPANRKITARALKVFQCPSQPHSEEPNTSYMMVVGPHTISDGPHSRKVSEITDGASNTIMLVEVADSGVRWAEPKDLNVNDLDFKINSPDHPGIGSRHTGANVVFCDGHSYLLSSNSIPPDPPERLKAMLTIDGGEKIWDD
jgi:prepilin-type processing-associated H-X9-DG protein